MTKLYHGPAGWQIPGAQLKTAAKVEVPSSPAPLAAWLNSRRVPLEGDAFDGLVPGNAPARDLLEEVRYGIPPIAAELDERKAGNQEARDRLEAINQRTRCPECKAMLIATAEGADKAAISRTIDRIVDWVSAAPDWAAMRLSEELRARGDEFEGMVKQ